MSARNVGSAIGILAQYVRRPRVQIAGSRTGPSLDILITTAGLETQWRVAVSNEQ